MADTVWFEVSCSQIPFVTLGQFGFQILCLDQSATFQEHQIRKTLGPQEQVRWYSLLHSRAGARTTKAVKFLGFVQEWTWCERHVFMMPSHHDTLLLAIRIVPASSARFLLFSRELLRRVRGTVRLAHHDMVNVRRAGVVVVLRGLRST